MDYLLDTHVVIWAISDVKKLSLRSKNILQDKSNKCFESIISLWEIGIKYSLGRLELSAELSEIFSIIKQSDLEILPVSPDHFLTVSKLEFHHNDPFDRLLIGQAISEKLIILSKDKEFKKYGISIW